jgi:hypothetical protein
MLCNVELAGVLNIVCDVVNNILGTVEFNALIILQVNVPLKFKLLIQVAVFDKVVYPLTFKLLIQVAVFDKVVYPLTFNDEQHVTLFENLVSPLTFNDEKHVIGCVS